MSLLLNPPLVIQPGLSPRLLFFVPPVMAMPATSSMPRRCWRCSHRASRRTRRRSCCAVSPSVRARGEARDDPVVARHPRVGFLAGVAPRQGGDPQHVGVLHALGVEVVPLRQRQLQHHLLSGSESVEVHEQGRPFNSTSACSFSGLWMSISGSMIGTRSASRDAPADLELLVDHRLHPGRIRELDDRAHLRPEDPALLRPGQQGIQRGHRLHHLGPVRFCRESLVDLEERYDALLLPQVAGGGLAPRSRGPSCSRTGSRRGSGLRRSSGW